MNTPKWKKIWEKSGIYKTAEGGNKPKYYVLDMFPYPSGAGLHVGHPKGYIATDIVARQKMMQGYNVLHPMGWDAFGLPAENYALKNKVHPADATAENIKVFKKQLGLLGFTYDWDREVNTTDPEYYKWTQWIFLQFLKRGLAYKKMKAIIKVQGGHRTRPAQIAIGKLSKNIKAPRSGTIKEINAEVIAKAARLAGAPKDKGAGIYLHKHVGDRVKPGEELFTVYAQSRQKLSYASGYIKENKAYLFI